MIAQLFRSLIPPRCIVCGDDGRSLCPSCLAGLPPPHEAARFPFVDRVLCPWDYEGAARRLILDLKLRGLAAAAEPLVAGMVDLVHRRGVRAQWVTYVPCRATDRRRRGFDHAEVLARGVARGVGLECRSALRRAVEVPDQAGLSAAQRSRNLGGVFVSEPAAGRVLVVDDLVTTGATASACARALRAAGALGAEVLAACRA